MNGKKRAALIAGLAVLLCVAAVAAVHTLLSPRPAQRAALLSSAIKMQNNSLRYLHTTWFGSTYESRTISVSSIAGADPGTNPETIEVLLPHGGFPHTGHAEAPVRSQASALYATAMALNNNTYDAARVGVSRKEALLRVAAWTNALAISYQDDKWARTWQSALLVYYLSYGAHQEWSSIPPVTQKLVDKAVASEANHLLTLPPPFYRNAKGKIIQEGDSKSEEDAWNGALLLLASREYRSNPNAAAWDKQGRAYMLAAHATPDQVGRDPRITGSNLNANGTVTNHTKINPDYMFTSAEMITKCDLTCAVARTPTPSECHNNLALVWQGLTRLSFRPDETYKQPGGTIYRRDKENHPTAGLYYPQGPDWSPFRRFNAAEMDVEIWALNIDSSAYGFAVAHIAYTLALQARHSDGMAFAKGESRFPEEEQFLAASAAEIVSRLKYAR